MGVGRGRPVRHRVPRPPQRAAQAGSGPRAPRAVLAGCTRTRLAPSGRCGSAHLIEGLRDGRVAMYTKLHHALVDGVSAMRLLQSILSTDPDRARHAGARGRTRARRRAGAASRRPTERSLADVPLQALRARARHQRRGGRPARRAGQDAQPQRPQRDLGALALRAAHDPQPADHRRPAASPPRTGRSSGSAPSARPPAPR